MRALGTAVDYLVLPAYMGGALALTGGLVGAGLPSTLAIGAVMWTFALIAAVLERLRPERSDWNVLSQPLATELAHYMFNYNLGYALGLGPLLAIGRLSGAFLPVLWPTSWPLVAQIVLAAFLGEMLSYWQHRLVHRIPWLWRFHALHHSGETLNLYRGARFHFVDIGPAFVLLALPLFVLRAPETIVTYSAALCGTLGAIQHSNVRVRTPRGLDWILCTPEAHRLHHSRSRGESDANFGTTVTLLDRLFGTWLAPTAPVPEAVGIPNDSTRPGFRAQFLDPFIPAARVSL